MVLSLSVLPSWVGADDLRTAAETSLRKGVEFFHSINTHGGYVYSVTPDLFRRWGEEPVDADTIEVQPPGTPAVGMSFLRAYRVTGDVKALAAAKDAAYALLHGQNEYGGWNHTINFAQPATDTVSFDDNQTQSAISFLMALDQAIDDKRVSVGVQRALGLMMDAQLDHGGWPHKYPEQGDYHDCATFNDGGINDCIRVMIEAHRYYGDEHIERSLLKSARFMMISQLPPPQPGWAQQYNQYLQPAWARSFEPPSVCPQVTIRNIHTLIDLYLVLGNGSYLEPIPDSLKWLQAIRMENGKWARFVELGTGKPLYYDRGRIRVDSTEELHPERRTGYGYESNLEQALQAGIDRFSKAKQMSRDELWNEENPVHAGVAGERRLEELSASVRAIIDSQEASGAWITRKDRFRKDMPRGIRWNGQYEVIDRIRSHVFNENVATLCEFIELNERLSSP